LTGGDPRPAGAGPVDLVLGPRRPSEDGRADLRADCARCVGLCCVAPAFTVSADFALDKPAGQPCPHLAPDSRCRIHGSLRERGFPGCTVFDCFGAGQQVTQVTFGGRSWREEPAVAAAMFDAFGVMRQLHELLWHLEEAHTRVAGSALEPEVTAALTRTRALTGGRPEELAALDVAAARRAVGTLLRQVADLVRRGLPHRPVDQRGTDLEGADLMGADLRGVDLRGAGLRGAYLIGADLRGADLEAADLLGADLRAADLRGAALAAGLFLTQPQLEAARGDVATTVPAWARRPAQWAGDTGRASLRPARRRRR
jgi:pentapeptide repeat protein